MDPHSGQDSYSSSSRAWRAATNVIVVIALEFVTLDARPLAVPTLVELVRDPSLGDVTVLATSRARFSVMGNEARAVVIGRSDAAAEPLESYLLELLRDPTLPEVDEKDLNDLL